MEAQKAVNNEKTNGSDEKNAFIPPHKTENIEMECFTERNTITQNHPPVTFRTQIGSEITDYQDSGLSSDFNTAVLSIEGSEVPHTGRLQSLNEVEDEI